MSTKPVEKTKAELPAWHPARLLKDAPYFLSDYGAAYLGDSLELLGQLPAGSVNLVVTSPPYALHFKKAYGNKDKNQYEKWFLPIAQQIYRVLRDDGSFVLNIGGSYNAGTPTRSIYHFKLLISLVEDIGFHLAQECFWYNPAKMPMPAEWVTVRRIRIRDSVEYVWWLSKTPWPKATNLAVLKEYSQDMIRLNRNGVRGMVPAIRACDSQIVRQDRPQAAQFLQMLPRPSFMTSLRACSRWVTTLLTTPIRLRCKEEGIKIHPARFPALLPKFFIKMLTDENDLVVDTFAGSNTTGSVAESLKRRWISGEEVEEYLKASTFRFEEPDARAHPDQATLFK